MAGRGHDRLRVPQRRTGRVRRPGRRGAADGAVRGGDRRAAHVRGGRRGGQARAGAHRLPSGGRAATDAARRAGPGGGAGLVPRLPHLRRACARPGRACRPHGGRACGRGGAPRARAAAGGARTRGVRDALPADDRPDHGQGRRGHRLLPLRPAARAERGRRRPGTVRAFARRVPQATGESPAGLAADDVHARHEALGGRARAAGCADLGPGRMGVAGAQRRRRGRGRVPRAADRGRRLAARAGAPRRIRREGPARRQAHLELD